MREELKLAGVLPLTTVMADLAQTRRIFHSEADFQFAFAQVLNRLDPSIEIRLEVRQPGDARQAVDLVCRGQRTTFIEFKYFTSRWIGTDPTSGEEFDLREHAATDLGRLNFIHDVRRLEHFVDSPSADDGVALLLSNAAGLWRPPGRRSTNDEAFRIHQDNTLAGQLLWAENPDSRHTHTLRGSYTANWIDYAPALIGTNGMFRWLAWGVD